MVKSLYLGELLFNEEMVEYDNAGDTSDAASDSEFDELVLTEPSKSAIYNRDGLFEKLEDIAWSENVEWVHKLTVDCEQAQEVGVNDDLARELSFYTQALNGTRQAFEKLQSMGRPFLRPPDYYAEMAKSDSHMLMVKSKLLVEKKKIEEAEERKKAREAKKISKEVQAEKTKERAKRKKEDIEHVTKWRKQRQDSGFTRGGEEEPSFGFDNDKGFERSKKRRQGVAPGDRSGGFNSQGGKVKGGSGKVQRREQRESMFGHGGRKGMKKQNTFETTDDFRGFNEGDSCKKRGR